MNESFDLKKLLSSPFNPLYWVKTGSYAMGFLFIAMLGYTIYRAYIKKPEPNQLIRAESGSKVTVVQNNQRKRMFIPFVEVYGEQRSSEKLQTGLRAGLRFEF